MSFQVTDDMWRNTAAPISVIAMGDNFFSELQIVFLLSDIWVFTSQKRQKVLLEHRWFITNPSAITWYIKQNAPEWVILVEAIINKSLATRLSELYML